MVEKRGVENSVGRSKIFVGLLLGIFLFSLVFAAIVVSLEGGVYIDAEDTEFTINFTINNTFVNDLENITQVNITMSNNFSFHNFSNYSDANQGVTFSNATGTTNITLVWYNATDTLVSNNSNMSFWFNVTVDVPGVYNLSIVTLNQTGGEETQLNISFEVNDTTAPHEVNSTATTGGPGMVAFGNYSGNSTFNFSVLDQGIRSMLFTNVTFANSTQNGTTNFSSNRADKLYWNGTIETTQYAEGVYNITIWADDNKNSVNNSKHFGNITFDNTAPSEVNVTTTPVAITNGNFSASTLIVNVSVLDALLPGGDVNFTFLNSTGGANGTNLGTKSGEYWWAAINTSVYPDGIYTISIEANDSAGNVNGTTQNFTNVRIDNAAPSVAFACTPTTVNKGSVVTCTCSPADSESGVNISATSFTANPSTATTGDISTTCTYADLAGNIKSLSVTYTVRSGGGGSGGGGGGGASFSYSNTFADDDGELSGKGVLARSLKVKERVRVKVNSNTHHVGIREISATSATIEIASDPVQIEMDVGDDAKVDLDENGFYDIYVKLNSITNLKADVTIEGISEEVVAEEGEEAPTVETSGEIVGPEEEEGGLGMTFWIVLVIVIIAVIAVIIRAKRR
tara:strand:- start:356 stop:2233 length:1878 start_codon:yes stop_codon:yes gene_type:complete